MYLYISSGYVLVCMIIYVYIYFFDELSTKTYLIKTHLKLEISGVVKGLLNFLINHNQVSGANFLVKLLEEFCGEFYLQEEFPFDNQTSHLVLRQIACATFFRKAV